MPNDNTPPPMTPSDMGRMLQSMRKKRGAGTGRPPIETACRKCKVKCESARAAWMHCAGKKGTAMINFSVIFDNSGGITLQHPAGGGRKRFSHHYYDGFNYEQRAAGDVKILLGGGDTADWDGNDPKAYETSMDHCRVYTADDLRAEMAKSTPIDWHYSGRAERAFMAALTGREIEE